MEIGVDYNLSISANFVHSEIGITDAAKQDLVEKLKTRIAELELELCNQKKAAERGERLLNVMRGDDFNDESLH